MSTSWLPTREPDALTRPRLLLAARLRGLRELRGVPPEAAGAAIGSVSLLQAMEQGLTASSLHHVMALAALYDVTDHATRAALLELALGSRREGWWVPYRSVISSWFLPYLGAEQAARVIRSYAVRGVPDLLQHRAYAEHLIRAAHPAAGEQEVRRRLDLRLRRQQVLRGRRPARLWVILDESVLRRVVGRSSTMYRQLDHLLDLCELPQVTIQILPLGSMGASVAAVVRGPITLVQVVPDRDVRRVVYLQQLDSALYPEDEESHRHAMNLLAVSAACPDATPGILRQVIRDL